VFIFFVFWGFCAKFGNVVQEMGGVQSYRHTLEVVGTLADMKISHRSDFD